MWLWKVLLLLLLLQPGIFGQTKQLVHYENPQCAVKGSTVTIPCSFTPLNKIIRVVWCVNHLICHGTTPSVYDSRKQSRDRDDRYRYLGDMAGNCTLQITNVQLIDNTTFRFRMEAEDGRSHSTGIYGANLMVTAKPRMKISSSSNTWTVGDTIQLRCSTDCSFHPLPITWKKNNVTIPGETGPSLTLRSLTEAHSGNYSCTIDNKFWTTSENFTLQLQSTKASGVQLPLILGVLAGVLLVAGTILLVFLTIRRKRSLAEAPKEAQEEARPEVLYSTVSKSTGPKQRRTMEDNSEVAYASVQFKPSSAAATVAESVIYSSVANQR